MDNNGNGNGKGTHKGKVLLIDDDVTLVRALKLYLARAGYEVITASNGLEGVQTVFKERPDIVVLDIMMPKLDGWEVCERIREMSGTPIIMLTALGQETDKVTGLRIGADDYLAKPFSLKELEARIEAVLRRATASPPQVKGALSFNDLTIDLEKWEVRKQGARLDLTATELKFLFCLAENAGRVLTHNQLLEKVWGPEYADETDYTKLFVWRLRQKIESDPSNPRFILTERGIGYRLASVH
jgi:two-component system KDP operon response regulator KdpE